MGRSMTKRTLDRRRCDGVTLIELMIVMSLITALAAMMLPSLKNAREQGRRTVCLANLKHMSTGLFTYAEFNNELGPPVMKPLSGKSNRSYLQRKLSDGTVLHHLGRLWPLYVSDAKIFLCPSAKKRDVGGKMSDLGKPNPRPVAGNYTYAVHVPALESPHVGASRHLALASDNFAQFRTTRLGHGYYTHKIGYNVLYTDGSATWYADPDESISHQGVHWDDERDDFSYDSIYDPNAEIPVNSYGSDMDIFRAWFAFCYNRPDPF